MAWKAKDYLYVKGQWKWLIAIARWKLYLYNFRTVWNLEKKTHMKTAWQFWAFLSNGSSFHATKIHRQNCAPHGQGGHEKSKAHKTILADLDGFQVSQWSKSHHPTPIYLGA